jgi:hypothetical protein
MSGKGAKGGGFFKVSGSGGGGGIQVDTGIVDLKYRVDEFDEAEEQMLPSKVWSL